MVSDETNVWATVCTPFHVNDRTACFLYSSCTADVHFLISISSENSTSPSQVINLDRVLSATLIVYLAYVAEKSYTKPYLFSFVFLYTAILNLQFCSLSALFG